MMDLVNISRRRKYIMLLVYSNIVRMLDIELIIRYSEVVFLLTQCDYRY